MSEQTKAEVRRLRTILTERGDYWDLTWDLPRLQAAYRHSGENPSSRSISQPCVLVNIQFEIISLDNYSHGYSPTDTDISIVAGDPLASDSFDLAPLASLRSSNQIQLYVSLGEMKGLCMHIIFMKLRSHLAFPLDELLLTPAGQFPAETEVSLWNIGTGVKTATAKIRVKVAVNHSVTEIGRSYSFISKSRNQSFPGPRNFQPPVPWPVPKEQKRSLVDPVLISRRDALILQISELKNDNDRLRLLLSQEVN